MTARDSVEQHQRRIVSRRERLDAGAGRLRQPLPQLRIWVGAGVAGQVGEEPVDPEPVGQGATAIEEGRGPSAMSGILTDSSYRLLPA